ncbi:heterokaryon incompatibility protein-domain-containing protein [Xylaria intraflava]|nr:heterokaryon incompatibility protein-domain-containing protein [Xylaria intraflava]
MDVQDERFDFSLVIVDKMNITFGYAGILFLADCVTTAPMRHILLATYVLLVLKNVERDVRLFAVQCLSLVLLWLCFYHDRDFSLISLYGAYLITKMTLINLGNVSLWMTTPGSRLNLESIVVGNTELAIYLISWVVLALAGWIIDYCTRPFRMLPASAQALMGTILVQRTLVFLDRKASSRQKRKRQPSWSEEQKQPDAEINENTASMYAQAGQLSWGRTIRLLKLLPQSSGEEVRCEIVNHDLDNVLQTYEAISYTWGDAKEAVVEVNGRLVRTSRKVLKMLRALRHTWKPRILWIDNICINQADANERSYQVSLMRHIYFRAANMIMWLDSLPDTEVAIDLLLEISQSQDLTGLQGSHIYGRRDQRSRLSALVRFIENDYFNRLWVTQEIASARNIQVLCGNHAIQWEDLSSAMRFMGKPEMVRHLQRTEEMGVVACNQDSLRHVGIILTTKTYVSKGLSSSLAFVLCNFRSFKCKDPRDKVFGLLGLVRNTDNPLIRPDYNKSEIQVYKDAAKYVLTVEGTSRKLLSLAFAGVGQCRRLQELPSWVPDWASNMRRKRVEGEDEAQSDHSPGPNPAFSYYTPSWSNYGNSYDVMKPDQSRFELTDDAFGYRASLESEAKIKMIDNDVLGIQGFLVDEIQSLTSVFDIPFDETMRISHTTMTLATLAWFEEAEALTVHARSPYPTGQSAEEIVWRTMIGDRLLETREEDMVRPAPREYSLIYRQHKYAAIDLRQASSVIGIETAVEVRDISLEIFTQAIGGGSIFKVLVEVLCGQSGHPNVWKLITTGTKFANGDVSPPNFSGVSDDAQFWIDRYEELCENEDTKDLVAVLVGLFRVFSPENSFNVLKELGGDSPQANTQDDSLGAFETDLSQKVAGLGPMVSRFFEGLRISFERRLCITKKGYVGLVPPLTRIGDRVAIFYGGDAPYLVRSDTNTGDEDKPTVLRCQLVGECYMHGMMDGEMMKTEHTPLWFHLS